VPQPGANERSATLAIVQAVVALVLLIVLPIMVETPETTQGIVASGAVALVLFAFLVSGVARFMRSRRRPYLDSMMPPPKPGGGKPPTPTKEE
jgi:hypothetical protein